MLEINRNNGNWIKSVDEMGMNIGVYRVNWGILSKNRV